MVVLVPASRYSKFARVAWLVAAPALLSACSKDNGNQNSAVSTSAKTPVAPVDVRTQTIPVPKVQPSDLNQANISQMTTAPVPAPQEPKGSGVNPNADVGYEGLIQRINELQNGVLPVLVDKNQRFTPETGKQAVSQSTAYMKAVQHASSVEKELRHELWDLSVDLNAGFMEMSQTSPGPRYDALRELSLKNIESIQRLLRENATAQ